MNTTTPSESAKTTPEERSRQAEAAKGIFSIIVLGMSAAIIAKTLPSPLRNAAIWALVASIISLFTSFRLTDGHWTTRARWGLAIATALWVSAFLPMYIFADQFGAVEKRKRSIDLLDPSLHMLDRRGKGLVSGGVALSSVDKITYVCAIFANINFLVCLVQWWYDFSQSQASKSKPQDSEAIQMTEPQPTVR